MKTEKTAVITGASRGIGKAIAFALAKKHFHLYRTCQNNASLLREVKEEIEGSFPVSCRTFVGDMGNYGDVLRLFSSIPSLDLLINNAGVSYIGLLSEMSPESWRRLMASNLDACFYTCKLAIPLMLSAGSGRIINISSVWGTVGASMEAAYSASKSGINGLTKALAKELAPSRIAVNAIACGVIDTDMNGGLSPEERQLLREQIPADRFGQTEEVAQLAAQLCDSPEYMTGQIITIDGGWTQKGMF